MKVIKDYNKNNNIAIILPISNLNTNCFNFLFNLNHLLTKIFNFNNPNIKKITDTFFRYLIIYTINKQMDPDIYNIKNIQYQLKNNNTAVYTLKIL